MIAMGINSKSITTQQLAKEYLVDEGQFIPVEEVGDPSVPAPDPSAAAKGWGPSTKADTEYILEMAKGSYGYAYVDGVAKLVPSAGTASGPSGEGGSGGSGSGSDEELWADESEWPTND